MTIKELIEQLNKYDLESTVCVNVLDHSIHIDQVNSFMQGYTEILLASTNPRCSWADQFKRKG